LAYVPTSIASVIAFFGLSAFGRIPAMLNFTNGAASLMSALRTAKINASSARGVS